ncbi:hypothetical protein MM5_214 [Morganella phage vB_Mm5]
MLNKILKFIKNFLIFVIVLAVFFGAFILDVGFKLL